MRNFKIERLLKTTAELKKENCSSKTKGQNPSDEEIPTTNKMFQAVFIETGEEVTISWWKTDTFFSTKALLNFLKDSLETDGFTTFMLSLFPWLYISL